ncbi:hypothetical protein NDU88_006790 [Pleurodeles waltl]|uniref:Uncharacterized protein n=1 Tax=Pleurodeles waltl TaxID=8319 RepID=A0AAV7SQT4_PLEWA|nr:hypothetical protein NDU88_006790 [Pleurodeles waltl]
MRIPTWHNSPDCAQQASEHEELMKLDQTKKAKMKEYAAAHRKAKPSTICEGDWVLRRQEQKKKTESIL